MASAQILKQQLLTEIEKLPEDKLGEVLDFVGFLLSRNISYPPASQAQPRAQDTDPLQAFIGGIGHGSLAQNIDEELYGG